ncbi:MAG: hypothetical protein GX206_00100 [Clostridiales bacterium]|nr:hypothetical protein [Clostridiales bacterium]
MDYRKEKRYLTKLLKQYKKDLDRFEKKDRSYEYENINELHRKILGRKLVIQNIESRIEMCKRALAKKRLRQQ